MSSKIAAKDIDGIPKRKENLAASSLFQPDIKALDIVTPDLDTPGKMAKACARPINKLSKYLWFFKFLEPFFELSAKYIKIAIKNEIIAIDKFERKKLSKK